MEMSMLEVSYSALLAPTNPGFPLCPTPASRQPLFLVLSFPFPFIVNIGICTEKQGGGAPHTSRRVRRTVLVRYRISVRCRAYGVAYGAGAGAGPGSGVRPSASVVRRTVPCGVVLVCGVAYFRPVSRTVSRTHLSCGVVRRAASPILLSPYGAAYGA